MPRILRIILFSLTALIIISCSSQEDNLVKELSGFHRQVETQMNALKIHIDKGRLRNIAILKTYADFVEAERPEMKKIVDVLRRDATSSGPAFQSLTSRLSEAKKQIAPAARQGVGASRELTAEYNAIAQAVNANEYNLMLSDPVNVLAGMSNGKLARVKDLANAQSHSGVTPSAGSELVGNPNYGEWRQNSSGSSFWAFYGQYAFFSSLFSSPVRYDTWASNRPSSYYGDRGRDYYTSPSHKQRYQQTEARERKNFSKQGKSFQSPYARSANSRLSNKSISSAPSKFQSTYGKSTLGSSSQRSSTQSQRSSSYNSRTSSSSRSFSSGGK